MHSQLLCACTIFTLQISLNISQMKHPKEQHNYQYITVFFDTMWQLFS